MLPKPPRSRGVFCNRTLNLRSVKAIGYDMDYTLVDYHVEEWERRAYERARDKFAEHGWPVQDLEYDPEAIIRGLVIDTELGNLVKANRFGFVTRAVHGTTELDFEAMRHDLHQRKQDAIARLPELIDQFRDQAEAVGAVVHLAATLEDACRITDAIAAIERAWSDDGRPMTTRGSMGQLVMHPFVGELRVQRMARNALWRQLRLPDDAGVVVPNQARDAAKASWQPTAARRRGA